MIRRANVNDVFARKSTKFRSSKTLQTRGDAISSDIQVLVYPIFYPDKISIVFVISAQIRVDSLFTDLSIDNFFSLSAGSKPYRRILA